MKRYWKPLVLILVIGSIVAILFLDYRDQLGKVENVSSAANEILDLPVGTAIGELAPDFTATTLDGVTIRLSEQRGKVVLVNAFATWCGPCLAETPHLVEIYHTNSDELTIVGLNMQENESVVSAYRDQFEITYPLVLDPDGSLTEIYKPIGLPTSWFIDPDGIVRYVHAGPMTADMIQRVIEEVAAGRNPDLSTLSG